jgi:hypothetical protein
VEFLFGFGFTASFAEQTDDRSSDCSWERILSEVCVDGFSLVLVHDVFLKNLTIVYQFTAGGHICGRHEKYTV